MLINSLGVVGQQFWLISWMSASPFWQSLPPLGKVFYFFLAWVVLWSPLGVGLALILQWRPPQPLGAKKLPFLASLYLLIPLILTLILTLEDRSWSIYGLTVNAQFFGHLVIGWLLGVIPLGGLFFFQGLLGWLQLSPQRQTQLRPILLTLLINFLLGFWVSTTEEVIFRGFLQTTLQESFPILSAAIIGSVIFALTHLIWEFRETLPQLPGLCLMGMVLVFARIVNHGSLALAIGLHGGWIWAIASLDTLQWIQYTGSVPPWVTGIAGKPLAGIVGFVLLLLTLGCLNQWHFFYQ